MEESIFFRVTSVGLPELSYFFVTVWWPELQIVSHRNAILYCKGSKVPFSFLGPASPWGFPEALPARTNLQYLLDLSSVVTSPQHQKYKFGQPPPPLENCLKLIVLKPPITHLLLQNFLTGLGFRCAKVFRVVYQQIIHCTFFLFFISHIDIKWDIWTVFLLACLYQENIINYCSTHDNMFTITILQFECHFCGILPKLFLLFTPENNQIKNSSCTFCLLS